VIAIGTPSDHVLERLVQLADSQCDGALSSILLLDDSGRRVRQIGSRALPASLVHALDTTSLRVPMCVTDILEDRAGKVAATPRSTPACAAAGLLPSSPKNDLLGVLATYCREARAPSIDEEQLAEAITYSAISIKRTRKQEALLESERRLRAIFDGSGTGICFLDLDAGRGPHKSCTAGHARLYRRGIE
jgi:hypothetical protein